MLLPGVNNNLFQLTCVCLHKVLTCLLGDPITCTQCTHTVLPPFPMTRPAAFEGTIICASNFTSSLAVKKFSSFNFPYILPCAYSHTHTQMSKGEMRDENRDQCKTPWVLPNGILTLKIRSLNDWTMAFTLNWASGGPVIMTILSGSSGSSGAAICSDTKHHFFSHSVLIWVQKKHLNCYKCAVIPEYTEQMW